MILSENQILEVKDNPNVIVVKEIAMSVGSMVLELPDKDDIYEVTVLLMKTYDDEDHYIILPMGTDAGQFFYTSEMYFQLRDMWNEYFAIQTETEKPDDD